MDDHLVFCSVEECVGISHRAGLCRVHYERKRRGDAMNRRIRRKLGSWSAVTDAMHSYFHAEADCDFEAATKRLRRAVKAWAIGKAG